MPTEEMEKRRQQIYSEVRKSPLPPEEIRPEWMGDGIEETFDYWNRLADIWDDLYPPGDVPFSLDLIPDREGTHHILDVGCGTASAWPPILDRFPGAHITGVELCPGMVEKARARLGDWTDRISLIQGHALDVPFGASRYDAVMSKLFIHFFSHDKKLVIYRKILNALKPGGRYIGVDLCTTREREEDMILFYEQFVSTLPEADRGAWNFKQTMSVATQQRLLDEAGFCNIEPWHIQRKADWNGTSVFIADRPGAQANRSP